MVRLDGVALGASPPDDINVLITTTVGNEPMAVGIEAASGLLTVRQLFHTTMRAPGNIGLIPATKGEGGEPLQAVVATSHAIGAGTIIAGRPVGVLYVTGEGSDEITVLCMPAPRLTARYDAIVSYTDLPAGHLRQLAHFFCHYRDLEENTRARSAGWGDVNEARRTILEAAERVRPPLGVG